MSAPGSGGGGLGPRFAELRDARERSAGSFEWTVAYARARALERTAGSRRRMAWALAAAVPALAGAALFTLERAREREALALAREAAAIAEWRPPTDALLRSSYAGIMQGIPSLGASVLDAPASSEGGSQ